MILCVFYVRHHVTVNDFSYHLTPNDSFAQCINEKIYKIIIAVTHTGMAQKIIH